MTKFARQTSVLNKQRVIHSLVTLASRTVKRCNSYCCRCSRNIFGDSSSPTKKLVKLKRKVSNFFSFFPFLFYLPNKGVSKKFEFEERIANIVPLMSAILAYAKRFVRALNSPLSLPLCKRIFEILMLFTNFLLLFNE